MVDAAIGRSHPLSAVRNATIHHWQSRHLGMSKPPLRVALLVAGRVPAARYGGTERVVPWLARELVRQGHAVTVIASRGSFVPGARMVFAETREAALALVPRDVDLLHFHSWFDPGGRLPSLNTLHGNPAGSIGPGNWS